MGNPVTERFNATLLGMLGTLKSAEKSNWKDYVKPMVHAYNSTEHVSTGFSPHYLLFGWHPRLAIDAFFGVKDYTAPSSSKDNYAAKLRKRLDFAYQTAKQNSEEQSERHKKIYDNKVRLSTLDIGDRVLIKNVTPKGKLDDKWQREPYLVKKIPDQKIPVYRVKKESGKGPVKTLHRNLILPPHSIPYEDSTTIQDTTKPIIPRQKRPTPEVDTTRKINVSSESDSSSETSEASPRYIIPPRRRPLPQPCVNFPRPELPSSISRATCDGKSSNNSTGRSNLAFYFQRGTPSFNNASFSRSQPHSYTDYHFSDNNMSNQNQSVSLGHRSESQIADQSRNHTPHAPMLVLLQRPHSAEPMLPQRPHAAEPVLQQRPHAAEPVLPQRPHAAEPMLPQRPQRPRIEPDCGDVSDDSIQLETVMGAEMQPLGSDMDGAVIHVDADAVNGSDFREDRSFSFCGIL